MECPYLPSSGEFQLLALMEERGKDIDRDFDLVLNINEEEVLPVCWVQAY